MLGQLEILGTVAGERRGRNSYLIQGFKKKNLQLMCLLYSSVGECFDCTVPLPLNSLLSGISTSSSILKMPLLIPPKITPAFSYLHHIVGS